jgi:signal transduction histidine kinase/FixJ family two-component response regulator
MARVLIVDDTAENLYLLRVVLGSYSHQVDEARNGAEAFELARSHPPDLLITDLLMPVMDGFALCRAWRAQPELKAIPIVIYTSTYTDPRDEQLGYDAGADAFLIKPAPHEQIRQVVDELLSGGTRRPARPDTAAPEQSDDFLRDHNAVLIRKLEQKVTDLDGTNRQLTEAQVFLRAVFDSLPAHVIVLDETGKIVSVSQPTEHFLRQRGGGYWLARLAKDANYLSLCRTLRDSAGEGARRVITQVNDLLRGRVAEFAEEFAVPTDDAKSWFAVTGSPLKTRFGWVVLTHIDITEKRRLEQQVLEAASQEQYRLGMDLHDGLGQDLTGLSLLLSSLATRAAREQAATAADLQQLVQLAAKSLASARAIAHGLSPVTFQKGGFRAALEDLARSTREMFQATVELQIAQPVCDEVPQNVANQLYRIAQEAISNGVKHGGASHITVALDSTAHELQLRIEDNGAGLPAGGTSQGRGLQIMRFRAKTIGAHLSVESPPGGGVLVRCTCAMPEALR